MYSIQPSFITFFCEGSTSEFQPGLIEIIIEFIVARHPDHSRYIFGHCLEEFNTFNQLFLLQPFFCNIENCTYKSFGLPVFIEENLSLRSYPSYLFVAITSYSKPGIIVSVTGKLKRFSHFILYLLPVLWIYVFDKKI